MKLPRVVLDTDTDNEVDDQFALAHLALSPERVNLEAVYAAPYLNERSTSPEDGMEKSYDEIEMVRERLGGLDFPAYRGSRRYLSGGGPVESGATADLIARAKASDETLWVVAIGACTNVASALLLAPEIASRIHVVWLGGHALDWPHTWEFNLQQDVEASRTLLEAKAPLTLVPCLGVTSHLLVTVPELEAWLDGRSALGSFLTQRVRDHHADHFAWAKELWDVGATAVVLDPAWTHTEEQPSPILTDAMTWRLDPSRPKIRVVRRVERNAVFADLYRRIAALP